MAKQKLFTVCLQVAKDHYSATGKNVVEALDKIQPPHIKAKGLFVVSHDGKQSQFQMYPAEIKKLLINKTFKVVFEKRMLLMLK